ncbi:MAG TPA: glycosyltransferase [Pyrinomonadaceae bacterium]|nr:glycosyltransferase [Pyrinomonadaceae bacterium]
MEPVSVIIPTLNEARSVGSTLDSLADVRGRVQVIIVDGGSDDDTREIVNAHHAIVITAKRGPGVQMYGGACVAQVTYCGSCTQTRLCPQTPLN